MFMKCWRVLLLYDAAKQASVTETSQCEANVPGLSTAMRVSIAKLWYMRESMQRESRRQRLCPDEDLKLSICKGPRASPMFGLHLYFLLFSFPSFHSESFAVPPRSSA